MIGRLAGCSSKKSSPDPGRSGWSRLRIEVPMSTFYNLPVSGERVTLLTHLVVREDAHTSLRFSARRERARSGSC